MIEIFKGNWTIKDVIKHSNKIFIYGDNNLMYGKGGQAVIRDLSNTLGIRTKKAPNNLKESFYTDLDYEDNITKIKKDIKVIKNQMDKGKIIVFSSGGYGTGLAKLYKTAPKTFEYLNEILLENFNFKNN